MWSFAALFLDKKCLFAVRLSWHDSLVSIRTGGDVVDQGPQLYLVAEGDILPFSCVTCPSLEDHGRWG